MITRLHVKNFRGIANAGIDLAPITILTGGNNTGKSSLMYALLTFKNVVSNPNQPLDSFFNYLFMNLGGFKETVHLKDEERRSIEIEIESKGGKGFLSTYKLTLGKSKSALQITELEPARFSLKLDVTFPYALNLTTGIELPEEYGPGKITWNGISPTVSFDGGEGIDQQKANAAAAEIGRPIEDAKGLDFIALRRGFTKPIFSPVPLQAQLITEDEIATFIANDRDLEADVSFYLEKIVNKNFQARPTLGTSNFYLHTTDRKTGFLCDLVNDGFGTNQLVYLLSKALRKGQTTICIEEPEIHLHPGAILRLVEVLIDIAKDRGRNFLISTHSEHFIVSLLNKLARQTLAPSDVRVYFLRKDKKKTIVEEQQVTENGQIKGGLKAFYETELEQLREFFEIREKR